MKRNLAFAAVLFLGFSSTSVAQELVMNCTQILRSARSSYDQGRLHEIPAILQNCLATGFSETEKIEALKILVQTYIYLEEPAEADKAMLTLLQTDHFFIPNKAVDPIEFQNLWLKFRYNPVWRVGVKFGALSNLVSVTQHNYVWANSVGDGKYSSKVGIQFGAMFEKDLAKKIVFAPEVIYSSYAFDYTNDDPLNVQDPDAADGLELTNSISQSRINLNLLFQYKPIVKDDPAENLVAKFIPFVSLGPSINYLASSASTLTANVTELVTGGEINSKQYYVPITFSAIAAVGIKYRIGGLYITADVRYQHGLVNIVNEDNRYNSYGSEMGYGEYGYIDNYFRLSQTSINFGIMMPKFTPRKLIK
jgi:hypothetical protein